MLRSIFAVSALLVGGCGGDDAGGTVDTFVQLPACTGVAYDRCTDTTNYSDCQNGMMCRLFNSDGFTICTPTCDASNPCPNDKNGNPVTCNMMGRCKATPNSCTP
jgi:hypothetical protein